MKKKRRIIIAAVLAVLLLAALSLWFRDGRVLAKDELVLHGNIDIRQVQPAFNAAGRIERVMVEEGDAVTNGQVLATLEKDLFQHAVNQRQAEVRMQEQVVARLEAGTRPEEIAAARAALAEARARLREAEKTYRRIAELREKDVATPQQLDDARGAADAARARVAARQAELDKALAGPRKEDVAAARATLARYQAALAAARYNLEQTILRAPAAGIVQERLLEPGDMASPQRPVLTLALTDPLWVRAYLSEPDLGRVREGMKAEVMTDSFPGKRYEAWVGYISPTAEFTPKPVETEEVRTKLVYQVRVFVKNPAGELRLGMPATVFLPLSPLPGGEDD